MVGMLDQEMLNYQQPQGAGFGAAGPGGIAALLRRMFGGGQPSAPLSPAEELAASRPAMIGSQPMMGADMMPGAFSVRGAPPIIAPGMGTMDQLTPKEPEPTAVTSLDGGAIPLPRPRRLGTDMSSRGITERGAPGQVAGEPMSLAPPGMPGASPAAPQMPGAAPGVGPSFRMPSAASLFAMASGFAGAPSFGSAMRRGFGNMAPIAAQEEQQRNLLTTQGTNQAAVYRSLLAQGVPPQQAMAALLNPKIMEETSKKYFGEGKEAPAGYKKLADGSLTFIKGGPADPTVKRELGERQNAPPGYMWRDPSDPKKGMDAIKGGPAEKVDSQVAARLGMGQSFLDQLPSIRKSLEAGEATGPIDGLMAKMGIGRAGELSRQIASGAEALLRNLTGAGMNMTEAQDYIRRYQLQPTDSVSGIKSKMNQLERELQYVMTAVGKGRGGSPTVVNGKLVIGDTEGPSSTAAPVTQGKTKSGIAFSIEED